MWIFNTKTKYETAEAKICKSRGYPTDDGITTAYSKLRDIKIDGKTKYIMAECEIKVEFDDKQDYNSKWEDHKRKEFL